MDAAARDAAKNRALWTRTNADYTDRRAVEAWRGEPHWGVWHIPDAELGVFGDVAGLDVVELGCGTAYVSAWLARAGARPVGVDITPAQLETARRCMAETGIEFPLVEADAGDTGLAAASADVVVSEYGASIWVDPYRWIREAARLLRPRGRLVFMCNSTLAILCAPDDDGPTTTTLQRPQRGMHRFEWDEGVEFHLPHGEWIDLLRANAFELERLVELYAPDGATTHEYYDFTDAEWARRWPAEEIWIARKAPLAGADSGVPTLPALRLRRQLGATAMPDRSQDALILASTSPQRRLILEQLRIPFDVVAPAYEEAPGGDPVEHAAGKARSVDGSDRPVLGVDTIVSCGGEVLGKPEDATDAERMLELLSGRTHEVVSGLCLRTPAWEELHRETTLVTFRELTPRDLAHYLASGEWEGRAGSYAIQGFGANLVERIEGDYLNVVGLPGALLVRLLATRFAGTYGSG